MLKSMEANSLGFSPFGCCEPGCPGDPKMTHKNQNRLKYIFI